MKYISTRNSKETFEFKEVFIKGLADDGGLFIPQSLNKYSDTEINSFRELEYNELAKKIIWNGPVGVFEQEAFSKGTKDLSTAIANSSAYSLAGGGETLLAIKLFINKSNVSYCSTGGGAFLEFMEGKELPSLAALGFKF